MNGYASKVAKPLGRLDFGRNRSKSASLVSARARVHLDVDRSASASILSGPAGPLVMGAATTRAPLTEHAQIVTK